MKRLIGFTALALVSAAFTGTAVGQLGGGPDPVQLDPSVDQLEILRCIGYGQVRLGLHNATTDHQYGDLFVEPTGPLASSRLQFSSYVPPGLDPNLPLRVTVPPDAAPGDYAVGYRLGAKAHASTPVKVVSDPAAQCVPSARMTATASSHAGADDASHAVDGDPSTIWRSVAQELPATITIDLGGVYDISELRYQPRFDGLLNGHINAYTIAVSTDGTTFTNVRTATWAASELQKVARLATPARGVRKLRVTVTGARNNLAAAAEFHPLGVPVDVPDASAGTLAVPNDLFAGRPVNATVTAGNWTNDPLPVDVSVDAPAGWKADPVRATLPPGVMTPVSVPLTPPAMPFPEPGVQGEVTLTGRVTPVGGGDSEGAPKATVWVKPDAPSFTYAYDAGTPSSVVIVGGASRLSPDDVWREGAVLGWVGTAPGSRDRGAGSDAMRRDHVFGTAATLRIAVPPGKHDVALLRGDPGAASGAMTVREGEQTLVSGAALPQRVFAWERFVLDGGSSGRTADLNFSGNWTLAGLVLGPRYETTVGGTVPATLSLALRAPASFGTFVAGREATYDTSTWVDVISTAGDATLSASSVRLRNGAFSLASPVEVSLSKSVWTAPVSNEEVTVGFRQRIGADEPLRTGSYSGAVTLTLATTDP
ncbi:discoidin domain-containing protein [Solirubrobacter sp. CPCC 204708]|uniref:Discoidin domain-containing protein n=1 Tax=Solirubrobacter deserti TaxID=2282478 RepID=A0ABT4RQ86_9ACTN|nr:discoidin domain-containing protein [Solirubrobacter deserti]MBE2320493.1 discoidin domain-containing protein [Solirubrobacter deserti]MDA0140739.1 discoidin domain-containing protein [Solirubrobacter deserti]